MKARNFEVEESDSQYWLWAILCGVAVVAIMCAAAYWYFARSPGLDKRLCPSGGPTGQVVLLVDKTDPLNFTQKQAFESSLDRLIAQGVPAGYLLSVFVLGEDFTAAPKPVFSQCNPGDGAEANAFTANKAHLRKRFEQGFRQPMLALSKELQASKPAKYSPILEMLEMASINGFRKEDVKGPRRLIIVSDMLHNTPQYSMYRGAPDFELFHDSSYGRKMQTDLNGVDVEIQYVINTPQLQTRRNLKFWEDYFASTGARIVAVKPLEG
ncbi:hypothetical protein [Paraburkholderia xenovorans]|uniref:hypothetical protein n=1 Tax=Paraburkholderia xenovorans TaxID=36873 RepID=UPI0038B96BD7